MKNCLFFLLILIGQLILGISARAQEFHRGEQFLSSAQQILPEQFIQIRLPLSDSKTKNADIFDARNPYTYLVLIYDSRQRPSQILYQTNFTGKIMYLGYSNNLQKIFTRKDKPMHFFMHCLRDINEAWMSVQISELAINCVLDRLNECAGP